MGFDFTGRVLRAPRNAPGNAATTSDPNNGVVRDVHTAALNRAAADPAIMDLAGDQYRAAVLEAPGTSPHEYLVWTAFSSQLGMLDDHLAWWVEDGSGAVPVGTLTVGTYGDGTLKVIATDDGGRQIGQITHLVIARGDETYDDAGWVSVSAPSSGRQGTAPYHVVVPLVTDQDPLSGIVTLRDGNVYTAPDTGLVLSDLSTLLDGGLSLARGDTVVGVRYTLSAVKFWRTRNDRYETRFGWSDALQRWMPYKGSAPVDLGRLLFDTAYKLSPPLTNLPVGAVLPGNALVGDEYAMLRLGTAPNRLSLPVAAADTNGFDGVVVVSDADAAETYDFSGSGYAGIVGQTNGILQFNPRYVEFQAGKTLWYVYRGFAETADGIIGDIDDDDLFLVPVPGPTDHPFVRINNRTPLSVEMVTNEVALDSINPVEGACAVALTTGKVKLAVADKAKADPTNLTAFNKHFLGATIAYDGVALNAIPQPTKGPRPLVQSDGVTTTLSATEMMYLPDAIQWPEDHPPQTELYRGLGLSGVLRLPDGTGAVPDPEGVAPAAVAIPVRPGGDTLPPPGGGVPPQTLGIIRQIEDGVGDTFLFSNAGAISELAVVDRNSELPEFPLDVPGGVAYIAREATLLTGVPHSKVQIGSADRERFEGKAVYFLQASLNPATFTMKASLYSKSRIVFRFDGDEVLYFAIDGTDHDWHASTLLAALPNNTFFTAAEVAASIQALIVAQFGTGICRAEGDRVVLEELDPTTGFVEIGWGATKDLSGAAALGFLPGWRAEGGLINWLSDAGISMGLFRSLLNLDRSLPTADYFAQYRLDDQVLADTVQGTPFVFFDYPPVEDIAGYDDGIFFNLRTVVLNGDDLRVIDQRLGHYEEIEHRFAEGKFVWLSAAASSNAVVQRTSTLNLGYSAVVPETLLGAPGINGGLWASEDGGAYVMQEQDVDYLFTDDGQSGITQLITSYGARVSSGGLGTYVSGGTTFTDLSANFNLLSAGDRLEVDSGSYIVQSITDQYHVEVLPAFIASSERAMPWEAFAGFPDSLYDPGLIADQVYEPFSHLEAETFQVRVLVPLGAITAADFVADVEDANATGRPVSLRFGPVHAATGVTATLTPTTVTTLGVMANNLLVLPTTTTHVAEGAFDIQIGSALYLNGVGLLPVATFSADPVAVEYLTADWTDTAGLLHPWGELKFNSTLLVSQASSGVVLVETLRTSANLQSGTSEYDPRTGAIRISAADAVTHAGKVLYFTEQMTADDMAMSPMVGSVSFRKPMLKGNLVEIEYWLADVEGARVGGPDDTIVEFLPVFVRLEETTRLTNHEYNLDPNGEHVIDTRTPPVVYVGPKQQNFGTTDFTVDEPGHLQGQRLSFDRDLPTWATPVASYAVFDAQGGERAYETSQKPVYRPPFFIPAGKVSFGIRGNRVADFTVGQMFRLGAESVYVKGITYYPDTDKTGVDIYPPTINEIGSRSPGNDVLALLTAGPITPSVDPDGTPVVTTAPAGFMQAIDLDDFPLEPISPKQSTATFLGDLTSFAVAGHVMEFAGMPFTIAQAELSEDGTRTKVTFTSPFRYPVDPANNPTVRLSYRPVYPPETRQFLGVGPFVASQGVTLTLFGETVAGVEQPGRRLAESTEFEVDPETGVIKLLEPLQDPLGPDERLLLSYTKIRVQEPFFSGGSVVFPRWAAAYKYNSIPTESDYLGGTLTASYTFDSPDSFYYRATTLTSYLAEAITQAVGEMKRGQSSNGPTLSVSTNDENWEKGTLGLPSQRRDLLDKDRAARTLLTFYNDTVVFFEQVDETISGGYIGDRDGKFRFWIGRGREYAPPGYEDAISGQLNPSNVWNTVFNEADTTRDIQFVTGDPLVRPTACTMSDLQLTGDPLNSAQLLDLMNHQRELVRNDVDDVLLLQPSTPEVIVESTAPYYTVRSGGIFSRMGAPHRYSRLYPTTARVLFTLLPGIGADIAAGDVGTYSYGKINPDTGEVESTTGTQIGQVANPVLGDIGDISEKALRMRLPRTRIFGYYPDGLPASAFGTAIERPCVVVSQVPLAELPIDPATGFPDVSQFISQGGDTPDAVAGDPEMALPGFVAGQKIGWGQPDGRFLAALYPEEFDLFGTPLFTSVLVDTVLHGCVLTFKNREDDPILNPSSLLVGTTANTGTPAHEFGIGRADTIYVLPPDATQPITDPETDPATVADIQQAALLAPVFRQGFDITVDTSGRVIDLSLPSWADPYLYPVKELMGQKTPLPMSHLEGSVDFANTDQLPLQVPALLGNPLDDAGDVRIPYMKGTNTELARLAEAGDLAGPLMAVVLAPGAGGAYPDEILFTNGEVLDAAVAIGGGFYREPATLMTNTRTNPVAGAGVAPAREGDFVLLEVDTGSPQGWQGFLTVGAIRSADVGGGDYWSWIEPPLFVTQADQGTPIQYELENYAVYTTPGNYPVNPQVTLPPGVRLFEDQSGTTKSVISFNGTAPISDVPLTINDGIANGVGNLNTILLADPANIVTIKLLSRTDGTATTAENPAGNPVPYLPGDQDGQVILRIEIRQNDVKVTDFHNNTTGWNAHGGVVFGVYDGVLTGEGLPATQAEYRHIVFTNPPANLFRFSLMVPSNQWFIPYTIIPGVRKESIYGLECAINVYTNAGESTSAYIDPDRLTFHEVIDFTLARPRTFAHELGGGSYGTALQVTGVEQDNLTGGGSAFTSVNDLGSSQTFVSRTGSASSIEGTFNPAASPAEEGSIRAMGFEYNPNQPITASGIVASVVASQTDLVAGTPILQGDATAEGHYFHAIAPTGGLVANVEKGDVVYVARSDSGSTYATTRKAGTYLVRHAVDPDPLALYKAVIQGATLGAQSGFSGRYFPRIVSLDVPGQRLELDTIVGLPATGKVYIVIGDLNAVAAGDFKEALFSVEYTGITGGGLDLADAAVTPWLWADNSSIGANLAAVDLALADAVVAGKRIGWHDNSGAGGQGVMDLNVRVQGGALPPDSVVGYDLAGTAILGFNRLSIENYTSVVYTAGVDIVAGAPAAAEVGVVQATSLTPGAFAPTSVVPVYDGVPGVLSFHLNDIQGGALNDPRGHLGGVGPGVSCILPGTKASTEDGVGAAGFYALGGIFTEPSLPKFGPGGFDLDPASDPNVVDFTRSLAAGDVGMVDPTVAEDVTLEVRRVRRWHGVQNGINDALAPLQYAYEIRRGMITDFSRNEQQVATLTASNFAMNFNAATGLPFVADVWNTGETGLNGTNLGGFDSQDVNINPGDTVRILGGTVDTIHDVLAEGVVQEVVNATVLKIAAPGIPEELEAVLASGLIRFEVYLRQTPVPHEQSNEQLLDLITDRVIHETWADYSDGNPQNWVGGYVPEVVAAGVWTNITNQLYDDSAVPPNFVSLGVRRGDIVIIDQAGLLPVVDERGGRPLGDLSVPTRTAIDNLGAPTATPYDPGEVSSLDDNRGFYRVLEVAAGNLTVDPVHLFAGTLGQDVLMGETGPPADIVYSIFPTVSTSVLNADVIVPPATAEGQNDLRPTRKAVGGTFTSVVPVEDKHSIRPFSYRIIRPNSMFSTEIVDTVLTIRERMLSLIELFRGAIRGAKGGYYWDWQNEDHVEDLGTPTDPDSGLGLFPNRLLETLVGETDYSPFINTRDCLSMLDRRVWILDRKLDSLAPDPTNDFGMIEYPGVIPYPREGGPYTAYTDPAVGVAVRPVLPDHLALILDVRDRLRAIRYTWLAYRTHRYIGTLSRIGAFDTLLPERLAERERVLLLEQTAEGVE